MRLGMAFLHQSHVWFVMAGLVRAIHALLASKDVDARDRRGHDDGEFVYDYAHADYVDALASASISGRTSEELSISQICAINCLALLSPCTGATSSRNLPLRPSSSNGTSREPSASSACRVNLPRAVVTVTRAGRSRG